MEPFEYVECPACDEQDVSYVPGVDLEITCPSCGTIFASPDKIAEEE